MSFRFRTPSRRFLLGVARRLAARTTFDIAVFANANWINSDPTTPHQRRESFASRDSRLTLHSHCVCPNWKKYGVHLRTIRHLPMSLPSGRVWNIVEQTCHPAAQHTLRP